MRQPITLTAVLAMGLYAAAAAADPVERGYTLQSSAFKGQSIAGPALFGQSIDDARGHKIFGEVVHLGRGCKNDAYPADPAGKVAMVERGTCPFTEKASKAQAAGAIAVIVYNTAAGGDEVMAMVAPSTFVDTIAIPSAFVGRSNAVAMIDARKPVSVQVKDKTRDKLQTRTE